MKEKHMQKPTQPIDTPYDADNAAETESFWADATPHKGLDELRAKRGRPKLPANKRKEQIALRVDSDVLAWYRSQGSGWQTRMNAVLKAYRDASG